MNEKILIVDDEPDVLRSFEALFRRRYRISTALDGEQALEVIQREGPFTVIIADMRMPNMDGVELLKRVAQRVPDTTRVMLTANADQQTAANAVNEGRIFRFLNKPCPMDRMSKTLEAATRQYHLVTAERVLLEQTLKGSVDVLVEALSLCNPAAFQQTRRIQRLAGLLIEGCPPNDRWEIEIAATLSQSGCLTVPEDLLHRSLNGLPLTPSESRIIRNHPRAGSRLIAHIPRLERVARMIALQNEPCEELARCDLEETVVLGAAVLRIAVDYDTLVCRGESPSEVVHGMRNRPDQYHAELLRLLVQKPPTPGESRDAPRPVQVQNLRNGMITAERVQSVNGVLVAPEGFIINDTVRHRLLNFAEQRLIPDMLRVCVPPNLKD